VRITICLIALLLSPVLAQVNSLQPSRPPKAQADGQWHRFGNEDSPARPSQNRPGHAGNWLRRYKDLPTSQQRRALENDPQFRRLPPPQQARLLQRLQHFSSLPPQQQERILARMETWEHLTQDQKQRARKLFQQFRQLPPERRFAVNQAIRSMHGLTPEPARPAHRLRPIQKRLLSAGTQPAPRSRSPSASSRRWPATPTRIIFSLWAAQRLSSCFGWRAVHLCNKSLVS
jgi:hypothetical protein